MSDKIKKCADGDFEHTAMAANAALYKDVVRGHLGLFCNGFVFFK